MSTTGIHGHQPYDTENFCIKNFLCQRWTHTQRTTHTLTLNMYVDRTKPLRVPKLMILFYLHLMLCSHAHLNIIILYVYTMCGKEDSFFLFEFYYISVDGWVACWTSIANGRKWWYVSINYRKNNSIRWGKNFHLINYLYLFL